MESCPTCPDGKCPEIQPGPIHDLEPPTDFVQAAMTAVPTVLCKLEDGRIEKRCDWLVADLERQGHSKAAARWALRRLVEAGKLSLHQDRHFKTRPRKKITSGVCTIGVMARAEENPTEWFAKPPKKVKRRKRPSVVDKPPTVKQCEVIQMVGECKGDYAEAARRLGKDRKTVVQHFEAGMKRLGKAAAPTRKTQSLPTDRRGQAHLSEDEDRRRSHPSEDEDQCR